MSSTGSLVQLVSRGFINIFSRGVTVLQAGKNFSIELQFSIRVSIDKQCNCYFLALGLQYCTTCSHNTNINSLKVETS